jgi:hypothetical protein
MEKNWVRREEMRRKMEETSMKRGNKTKKISIREENERRNY